MTPPAGYDGPVLEVITRNIKQEEIDAFVGRVMEQVPSSVTRVALFESDKVDSDLTKKVLDTVQSRSITISEMKDYMNRVQ